MIPENEPLPGWEKQGRAWYRGLRPGGVGAAHVNRYGEPTRWAWYSCRGNGSAETMHDAMRAAEQYAREELKHALAELGVAL